MGIRSDVESYYVLLLVSLLLSDSLKVVFHFFNFPTELYGKLEFRLCSASST